MGEKQTIKIGEGVLEWEEIGKIQYLVILVNSVLDSLPTYVISLFLLSVKAESRMNTFIKKNLYLARKKGKKMHSTWWNERLSLLGDWESETSGSILEVFYSSSSGDTIVTTGSLKEGNYRCGQGSQ